MNKASDLCLIYWKWHFRQICDLNVLYNVPGSDQ